MPRHLPPPWKAEKIPGGFVIRDANSQALAYVYSRICEKTERASVVRTTSLVRPPHRCAVGAEGSWASTGRKARGASASFVAVFALFIRPASATRIDERENDCLRFDRAHLQSPRAAMAVR